MHLVGRLIPGNQDIRRAMPGLVASCGCHCRASGANIWQGSSNLARHVTGIYVLLSVVPGQTKKEILIQATAPGKATAMSKVAALRQATAMQNYSVEQAAA